LSQWTLNRLSLLVSGILKGQSGAPARIAQAGHQLSEGGTQPDSVERRVRRIENDAKICTATCFVPLVQALLANSPFEQVLLIVDPSLQEDRVVLVSINLYYRGRALPLAWAIWPANHPLEGAGFWERIDQLLTSTQRLLPPAVAVTVLADRAFGTSAFTDRVEARGWHWIVRVQGQTRCRERRGRERPIQDLVRRPGERRKLAGQVFKQAGWRPASVVVYWGRRFRAPLCLATDLPPAWERMATYRHRFPVEPSFRDLKSSGWQWEHCQVTDLAHLERLLIGMALATWLTLLVGALQARSLLSQKATGKRHTRPWYGKKSLFRLGLEVWASCFAEGLPPMLLPALLDCQAPNWNAQIYAHCAHAFIFA
jgi:hypothetical protein